MTEPRNAAGDEHAWFATRMVASAAGLLADTEQERFEAHLSGCTQCRGRWLALVERDDDEVRDHALEAEHVPSAILARWPQAGAQLLGVERETVLAHVEGCAQCRQDLELLGFQPRWGTAPLEPAAPPIAAPRAARRAAWFPWLLGGLSGAAVTAAVLLVMMPIGRAPGDRQPTPSTPRGGDGGAFPWVAPLGGRGGQASVELPPDAHELVITAPAPLEADPRAAVQFEVFDPAGSTRLRGVSAPGQTEGGALVLLLRAPDPLPAGGYRVVLRAPAADGSGMVESELRFEVRRSNAP